MYWHETVFDKSLVKKAKCRLIQIVSPIRLKKEKITYSFA